MHPLRRGALLLAAAIALAACGGDGPARPASTATPVAGGPSPASDAAAAASRFDERAAMDHVRTLAQPQFMGRHTGTPGEELGAKYLADQFRSYGLKPVGDNGTFLQQFPVTVTELSAVPILALTDSSGAERSLKLRDDFRPLLATEAGTGSAEGPAIFAGTGDFSGVDAKGKVAVVVPRMSLNNVMRNARAAGAVALLLTTGEQPLLKGEAQGAPSTNALPVGLLSANGATALLEGSGHTRDDLNRALRAGERLAPFPLAFRVRYSVRAETKQVQAHNVLAMLPAAQKTDDTYIVGGHYEEIGPDPDGVVYPAANDNASGTAVLLAIAKLLQDQKVRPHFNILFIGWSGHEEGLLGSAYYVNHPAVPLDKTRAYLNLDTVGQGSGREVFAGVSNDDMGSLVTSAADKLEAATGVRPPVQISRRDEGSSDHETFQRKGIPTIDFNWTGILDGGRIHVPEDNADNVDPAKLKVTGQVAAAALLLAVLGQP